MESASLLCASASRDRQASVIDRLCCYASLKTEEEEQETDVEEEEEEGEEHALKLDARSARGGEQQATKRREKALVVSSTSSTSAWCEEDDDDDPLSVFSGKVSFADVTRCQEEGTDTLHTSGKRKSTVHKYQKMARYAREWFRTERSEGDSAESLFFRTNGASGKLEGCEEEVSSFLCWLARRECVTEQMYKEARAFLRQEISSVLVSKGSAPLPEHWISDMQTHATNLRLVKERGRQDRKEKCTEGEFRSDLMLSLDDILRVTKESHLTNDVSSLQALQACFAFNSLLAMGNRPEHARYWKLSFLLLTRRGERAHLTFKNILGKKTEQVEFTTVIPHRNPLLCSTGKLGHLLLYRFFHLKEPFPNLDDPASYCNFFLLRSAEDAARPLTDKAFRETFHRIIFPHARDMQSSDSVTHLPRHICQAHAQLSGMSKTVIGEALNYDKRRSTTQDVYSFLTDEAWLLERAGYDFKDPQQTAAHVRAAAGGAGCAEALDRLVDRMLPELAKQERTRMGREESMAEEAEEAEEADGARSASKKERQKDARALLRERKAKKCRKGKMMLSVVRHCARMFLVCSAARPRDEEGSILFGSPPLHRLFEGRPTYKHFAREVFETNDFREVERQVDRLEREEAKSAHTPQALKIAEATADVLGPNMQLLQTMTSSVLTSTRGLIESNPGLLLPPAPPLFRISAHVHDPLLVTKDEEEERCRGLVRFIHASALKREREEQLARWCEGKDTVPASPLQIAIAVPHNGAMTTITDAARRRRKSRRQEDVLPAGEEELKLGGSVKTVRDAWNLYAQIAAQKRWGKSSCQKNSRLSHLAVLAKEVCHALLSSGEYVEDERDASPPPPTDAQIDRAIDALQESLRGTPPNATCMIREVRKRRKERCESIKWEEAEGGGGSRAEVGEERERRLLKKMTGM